MRILLDFDRQRELEFAMLNPRELWYERGTQSRMELDAQLELLIDCAVRGKYRFRRRYEVNAVVQRHRELSGLFRKRQLEAPQADN